MNSRWLDLSLSLRPTGRPSSFRQREVFDVVILGHHKRAVMPPVALDRALELHNHRPIVERVRVDLVGRENRVSVLLVHLVPETPARAGAAPRARLVPDDVKR